ncbi:MAG: hypothetical protein JSR46_03980 [Verrucomicrobia bacterium]|nr:hypothetical protein [Verrucomicrobiota bacterium]
MDYGNTNCFGNNYKIGLTTSPLYMVSQVQCLSNHDLVTIVSPEMNIFSGNYTDPILNDTEGLKTILGEKRVGLFSKLLNDTIKKQ